jgi:hypothetical protein
VTLLSPLALALSAVAVPVILLYVLKLRRREQDVSSTLLWRRATYDMQANAPWQRLRITLPLVLQVLALLALVLVLAQPAYTQSSRVRGDIVLIVDQSYGMQASDVSPSRFAAALARAHAIAGSLGSGNVMSVIGMAAQPHVAIADSADGAAISQAIDGLRPGVSTPNFLAALSLARSLARGAETQVIVLTSRQSGISSLPLTVPFPVRIERIGGNLRDLAVTNIGVRCAGGRCLALARVSNLGVSSERSDLQLSADGQIADVRPLSLRPGAETTVFSEPLPAGISSVHAQLTARDDVTADKSAWAVVGQPQTLRVLLVSRNDFFLQSALDTDPSIRLTAVKPAAYSAAVVAKADAVIFDGWVPSTLPATPALVVAPPGSRAGPIRLGASIPGFGAAAVRTGDHTLSAIAGGIDFSDVHVARLRRATLPGWMQPLVETGSGEALVAAGEGPAGRMALIPFDLQQSDWPLRISFPVVVQNLVHYLAPGLTLDSQAVNAGSQVHLFPSPGTSTVQVTQPDGSTVTLRPPFPPYADTAQPGIYRVRQVGSRAASAAFAVNFFPSRPAPAAGPAVQQLGVSGSGSSQTVPVFTGFGWVFWLLAMGLLTAEWWAVFRR